LDDPHLEIQSPTDRSPSTGKSAEVSSDQGRNLQVHTQVNLNFRLLVQVGNAQGQTNVILHYSFPDIRNDQQLQADFKFLCTVCDELKMYRREEDREKVDTLTYRIIKIFEYLQAAKDNNNSRTEFDKRIEKIQALLSDIYGETQYELAQAGFYL
jgi:hypothetical protein